ncbi:hypothetical protein [Nocardia vinacea]|uniref:hypothetical protein n=1 Tax=Nocardia vinacea TaxID=96468 RepID=UPI0002DE7158|nr:hypothetical protein [Nocardia vinacea]
MIEDEDALEFFPIAIGEYPGQTHLALPTAEDEIDRVATALQEFGVAAVPWDAAMPERGSDAVDDRLSAWTKSGAQRSLLLWVGHGWRVGTKAALAHAKSPDRDWTRSITPDKLASVIAARVDPYDQDQWSIIVVDACASAIFVQRLSNEVDLQVQLANRRFLLVGVSGDGPTNLGKFSAALETALEDTFGAESRISLWDLAGELRRLLPGSEVVPKTIVDAALCRRVPAITGTMVDLAAEIRSALRNLDDHERRHFVAKAQGGDGDDYSWFFQGRVAESRLIVTWLAESSSGLLVVTGRPGSGKSALLGQLAVRSAPTLREVLIRHGLLDPVPDDQRPPDGTFDLTVHLTGMNAADLVDHIAMRLALGRPPEADDSDRSAWLLARLGERSHTTLLMDALDEAAEPIAVAEAVIRPLALLPGVRVIVGTRQSTRSEPDRPAPEDQNLLDALHADPRNTLCILPEPAAVARYVASRLLGNGTPNHDPVAVAGAAATIATHAPGFLFAHLVVAELQADPALLTDLDALEAFVRGDHRAVFRRAVTRLAAEEPSAQPLLHALALAHGRGLPIRDGVWNEVAGALAPDVTIGNEQIRTLLRSAAAYLVIDREREQTVYRLAHRTFAESFTELPETRSHRATVADALLMLAARETTQVNPYVATYLAAHIADGGGASWDALGELDYVIGRLDIESLASAAARAAFGRFHLPPQVMAVLGSRHVLTTADTGNKRGIFQLAAARLGGSRIDAGLPGDWSVRWAMLAPQSPHLTLRGHRGAVHALATVRTAGGRILLSSGGSDGIVRLWDPSTGRAFGRPMSGHRGGIYAIVEVPALDILLASAGEDTSVRLWNPMTGLPHGAPLRVHRAPVRAMDVLPGRSGRVLLATGDDHGDIVLWDVGEREAVWGFPGFGTGVRGLVCTITGDHGTVLFAGYDDGTVRVWREGVPTPVAGPGPSPGHSRGLRGLTSWQGKPAGSVLSTGHDGQLIRWSLTDAQLVGTSVRRAKTGVCAIASAPLSSGGSILAAGDNKGIVHLFRASLDANTRTLTGHRDRIRAAVFVPEDNRLLLATAGNDAVVRLWSTEESLTSSDSPPRLTAATVAADRGVLVTGDADGVIRWYAVGSGTAVAAPYPVHNQLVTVLRVLTEADGETLLVSADTGGSVFVTRDHDVVATIDAGRPVSAITHFIAESGGTRVVTVTRSGLAFWDPLSGASLGHTPASSHRPRVVTDFVGIDGRIWLASGGYDATVYLWDAQTHTHLGTITGLSAKVNGIAVVRSTADRPVLAVATNNEVVRLWDTVSTDETPVGLVGHHGPVRAIAAASTPAGPRLLTAGDDQTLRIWDAETGMLLRTLGISAVATALTALDDNSIMVTFDDGIAVLDIVTVP